MTIKGLMLNNLKGRKIFIFFILASAIYLTMLFITIEHLVFLAEGYKPLDMLPLGYNQEYVTLLLSKLGVSGRDYYLTRQLPLDFLYPAFFAITYSLLFAYLLKKVGRIDTKYFYLAYLPILAGAADYVENLFIIYFIKSYPAITASSVNVASGFSVIKSVTTSLYYVFLVVLVVLFAKNYLFSKNKSSTAHHTR
ncbi:hypothetical protein [Pontibacter amylolyticus]|uniref:DUF2079 domain-containing protein n=1 Tax=Pontibacter amylolyticus TaxID=1424080 RepID=A0ABQ1WAJ8_9BACT|nr:hypothetical protein [Pontibacter amylolyticus]GGG20307.1 hypothetical protein GCM10011323_25480 [Pontibacter amylolyticus]